MFLRRLVIIIIAITALAAGFQVMRSLAMISLIKNVNSDFTLPDPTSASIPGKANPEKYLIVLDEDSTNSKLTTEHVAGVLDYMKKDYEIRSVGDRAGHIKDYDSVLFIFERLDFLDDLDTYLEYVREGGSIAVLIRPVVDESFRSISDLFGIGTYKSTLTDKYGIDISTDFMIGAKDFKTDADFIINSSLEVSVDDDCTIHAKTSGGVPLVWTKDYGDGKFVMLNGTMLNEKASRGFTAAILGLARDELIYPIMNVNTVHIDDFPAPIPEGKDEKIYEEFNRDIPQFYREVWWSDMIKMAKKYDLKYTGFVIEFYNDITYPPFERATVEIKKNLLLYGRELLGIEGEMGIHGYNHQSLALDGHIKQDLGYNSWESVNDMVKSLEELLRFVHSVFGKYEIRAYVPPSNILSPEGREALLQAVPDLKIIASQYYQNLEGDIYSQEYEVSPDGIIEFPRITSGYGKSDRTMWNIYNGVNMHGVFSHFIHPDDILDPDRNEGKSWTLLSEEFDAVIGEVDSKYGWLRGLTMSVAAQEMVKYVECRPVMEYGSRTVNIYTEDFRNDIYCILKTEKEIIFNQACEYVKIGDSSYLLTLKDDECSLVFR